ncbi:MAG: archaemetzincin family Zn-dependent metalloprotease [Betaproteobacteria bacterium]
MRRVLIIPVGEVDSNTLDSIARAIRETYRCETVLGGLFPVPQKTYNTRRKQYHSTKMLKVLEVRKPAPDELLLGVIDEDCYVPELNFVFGEADILARIALIALPRLRQEFYGLEPDRELFLLRAAKEAIHELGHTCGLGHCPDHKCIMHFSNSLRDTDVKAPGFCNACRNKIGVPT